MNANVQTLIEKIQTPLPERLDEVEDFVDFPPMRKQRRAPTRAAAAGTIAAPDLIDQYRNEFQ